jgi:hypothetical protein
VRPLHPSTIGPAGDRVAGSFFAGKFIMITFDEATEWAGGLVLFWADRANERIRCAAGRDAIARLPGFAMATRREIGARKTEIKNLLKPYVLKKLDRNEFDLSIVPTITITVHDL